MSRSKFYDLNSVDWAVNFKQTICCGVEIKSIQNRIDNSNIYQGGVMHW